MRLRKGYIASVVFLHGDQGWLSGSCSLAPLPPRSTRCTMSCSRSRRSWSSTHSSGSTISSPKSRRKIGVGLLVGGLIVGILWVWYSGPGSTGIVLIDVIIQSIGVILAAIIGAAIAIGLFLLAIMKS